MSEKTASAAVKEKKILGKKPVARKDMSKVQWILKEMKRNYVAYIMCAPFFLIFFTFTILPVILSLYYSFTIFNLIETEQWVWFDNYIRLFLDDDIFLIAVQNTLIFAVIFKMLVILFKGKRKNVNLHITTCKQRGNFRR